MGAGVYFVTTVLLAATALAGQVPGGRVPTGQAPAGVAITDEVATADTGEQAAPASTGAQTGRLAGADRYASAVAISRHRFADPAQASTVYLARADDFSDALTAGSLTDGPVLLTRGGCGAVPATTLGEVRRIDPDQVVALGGPQAVCEAALETAAQGRDTGRIGGESRQETAVRIAERAFPDGTDRVYLTRGSLGPDAVVGGQLSDGPVLTLTADGSHVPTVVLEAINSLGATEVVALGGPEAVPEASLVTAADGRRTDRLAGDDRYRTAIAIARHAYPERTTRAYLARGDGSNFVDAVASGMLIDGPVVLTPGTCERLRPSTAAYLKDTHPDRVIALGGPNALCDSTLHGASLAARPAVDCGQVSCVALTFDDGPSWPTPTLLNTLAEKRVPATFFLVGQQVSANGQHSRRAVVEGHQVENHTWSHPELPRLTWSQQKDQLDRTNAALTARGIPRPTLLRPPYGSYNANTRTQGYPLIIWDVDPEDWRGHSAAAIREHVVTHARAGSIVLQHDIHINSVNAVPGIIDDLHARGFTFVTVQELVPTMRPGDLVYRRGHVVPAEQPADPGAPVVLPDGTDLGILLDGGGIGGVAPQRTEQELLDDLAQ